MALPLIRPRALRTRLLAAFVFVAVVPILGLSLAFTRSVAETEGKASERRLSLATAAVKARLDQMRELAAAKVASIAFHDLPAARTDEELLALVAEKATPDLPLLEVVGSRGVTIASRHWPAGEGLSSMDVPFGPDGALRVVRVAEGFGAGTRLAVTAAHEARWRGDTIEVRGGYLIDDDFLASLEAPLGMSVAFLDDGRKSWWARRASPLPSWGAPGLGAGAGNVTLQGLEYRWASRAVAPSLFAVVAVRADEVEAVGRDVARLAFLATLLAVVAAVLAAFWLSGWISRPVRQLALALEDFGESGGAAPLPEKGASELSDLARAFNRMTAELEESRARLLQAERVAAWREMARRLAHELKNPLFPMQVSIETLQRAYARAPEAEASRDSFRTLFEESCQTILLELRLLRKIIDEFSAFARMPRPRFEATDVNAVVEQVLALYRPRAGAVALEADLDPAVGEIAADRDLLTHALGNLVANALDAMPGGGTLRVEIRGLPRGVSIAVRDTGRGIPDEQRTRLFTPYFTTKTGGTGLGLSIAQSIVSDHGGRIEVETSGEGTTFTLVLPSDRPRPPSERGGEKGEEPAGGAP